MEPKDESKHSRIGASKAERWVYCTASPNFIDYLVAKCLIDDPEKEVDSKYAIEGKEAHAAAEKYIKDYTSGIVPMPLDKKYTDEGLAHYTNECVGLWKVFPGATVFIEHRTPIFYNPEEEGTLDFALVQNDQVIIRDLKWGAGVFVDAFENRQLAIYALSLINELEEAGLYEFVDSTVIDMGIVQPRHREGEPVRQWVITLTELRAFCDFIEYSANIIKENDNGRLVFAVTEKGCRFCPAKVRCHHRTALLYKGIDIEVVKKDFDEHTVSSMSIANVIAYESEIKNFISAAKAYATKRAIEGNPIDGTKLVGGRSGNRKFIFKSPEQERELDTYLRGLGIELYEPNLRSVRTIESDLSSKLTSTTAKTNAWRVVNEYIGRKPAGPVIAHFTDKRKTWAGKISLDALPDNDEISDQTEEY
jgi:hypothetical protein